MPLTLRTSLMKEVSSKIVGTPKEAAKTLLFNLLIDSEIICIKAMTKHDQFLTLDEDISDNLLSYINELQSLNVKHLELQGMIIKNEVVPKIIALCPDLKSLKINGENVEDVLDALQTHCPKLQSLSLDGCWVRDADVVRALLKTAEDFATIGEALCNGEEIKQEAQFPSLTHLEIFSPLVSMCGATVLLNALKNLKHMSYSYWSTAVGDALLFLKQIYTPKTLVSISSLSIFRVTLDKLTSVVETCPKLKHLMLECVDSSVTSLSQLSSLKELSSLNLRLLPKNLIISALEAVGSNLTSLEIDNEQYSYKHLPWDAIEAIHIYCPNIQKIVFSNIELKNRDYIHSLINYPLNNLTSIIIKDSLATPFCIEKLIQKKFSLKSINLNINRDAVNDQLFNNLFKCNEFKVLNQISLAASSLTSNGIHQILSLPNLSNVAIDFSYFSNSLVDELAQLQESLKTGNFLCSLHNSNISK